MRARLPDGLLLALGTFTAVPVPPPRVVDRATGRVGVLLAVVPGALLGVLAAAVAGAATGLHLPPLAAGLLAVAALLLATRAFHADGLADLVDGLSASYDRERTLAVMRTGDVGPAGAAALVVVLGLDAVCLGELAARGRLGAIVLAVAASRAVLALACHARVPAARPGGLGALVAGTTSTLDVCVLGAVVALAALPLGPGALAGVVVAALAAVVLVRRATARLGGVTGDVLGAVVEASLAAAFVALLATP